MNRVEILSTHPDLMKLGVRSTESSMLELIEGSTDEIQILSYSVTDGAKRIMTSLEGALARGIRLTFILDRSDQTSGNVLSFLRSTSERYAHSNVYAYSWTEKSDLHAKIMVADRRVAIVGSSNLTARGLLWNLEIGFLIEHDVVWKLSELIDKIVEMSTPLVI